MDKNMSEPTQNNRKKSRRRNGDGNTYRHKNGWRTVISHKGQTVTAMGRSEQESRRLAKEKIKALPIYDGSLVPAAAKLTTGEFLTNWILQKQMSGSIGAMYIDLHQVFCFQNLCPPIISNTPVFFDGNHISYEIAVKLIPYFAEELNANATFRNLNVSS